MTAAGLERHYDRRVSADVPAAGSHDRRPAPPDPASSRWVERLSPGHPRREQTVATLHEPMHRAARHELHRRRGPLPSLSGPEFDDIAQQCADDAVVNVLARVDQFRRLSRFTTRAYKFVMFEVSVDMELRGEDPTTRFPGTSIHLRVCPGCRADHDGLLEAARRFGDLDPE